MENNELNREVMDRDFSRKPTTRESMQMYYHLVRGDYRLAQGLYRTEAEQAEFIERARNTPMPDPRPQRGVAYIKYIFGRIWG